MAELSSDAACLALDVSRETKQKLIAYVALLTRWQEKINLVSKASLAAVWERHILDCGQIFKYLSKTDPSNITLMDIGSGAGLPGLVLALLGVGNTKSPPLLVESDMRKCAFLKTAAAKTETRVNVMNERIENLMPLYPDVITARALASLEKLLEWTKPQHHQGLECFFMKGKDYAKELTCLDDYPNINAEIITSQTNPESVIIKLTGFRQEMKA